MKVELADDCTIATVIEDGPFWGSHVALSTAEQKPAMRRRKIRPLKPQAFDWRESVA